MKRYFLVSYIVQENGIFNTSLTVSLATVTTEHGLYINRTTTQEQILRQETKKKDLSDDASCTILNIIELKESDYLDFIEP